MIDADALTAELNAYSPVPVTSFVPGVYVCYLLTDFFVLVLFLLDVIEES